MSLYEILSIIGQYAGLLLIFYGLTQMSRASRKRDRELDEIIRHGDDSRRALHAILKRMED